jgi:inactivated superfamily I helicase
VRKEIFSLDQRYLTNNPTPKSETSHLQIKRKVNKIRDESKKKLVECVDPILFFPFSFIPIDASDHHAEILRSHNSPE